MFGRSRSWVGQGRAKNVHSLDQLKHLYHVLTKNTTVTDHNKNLLVETIRSITENLIWGDQNDSSVFELPFVNNHVNSIIVHKFDFSDEEIMAYYISFLKTLSLKLNNHTVHFFYNEHTNDFALYTEAIKFFNHPESMVRIAVRTITLNVYKVSLDNQHMLHYIRDKTAVPYFSNLVWFIGSHVIELDKCVQTDEEHKNRGKLSDLVAEHLDHLHYLNDILIINCEFLNDVLTDHLLNRLFLPLYVYSLINPEISEERKINPQVSLYLLSQVFLIIHYQPLVNSLADVILNGDLSVFTQQTDIQSAFMPSAGGMRRFIKPPESLERSLEMSRHRGRKKTQKRPNYKNLGEDEEEDRAGLTGGEADEGWDDREGVREKAKGTEGVAGGSSKGSRASGETAEEIEMVVMDKSKVSDLTEQNITDEEKTAAATCMYTHRPFLEMVYTALDCTSDDYQALFVLCLLYAISHSKGINRDILERLQLPVPEQQRSSYNVVLVERLIRIMSQCAQPDGRVRLATLELSCLLLKQSVLSGNDCIIKDVHLACLEGAREESLHLLRTFYKSKPLNVEYLMMDASILLPPTGTPLTGIDFVKRLPCGDVEKTRRAIRVLFMLRSLSLHLQGEPETQLPLTRPEDLIKTDDVLDLNNSDLIACMVVSKDGIQAQRFLAVDVYQMSLVEPDTKRLGWGVVKFAGLLQANFIFADHIRCIIAKQRLAKGRIQARRMKMQRIAALLELPVQPCASEVLGFGQPFRFYEHSRRAPNDPTANRSVFATVDKVPVPPLCPPFSPSSGSGSTGRCDSVTASTVSTQSPADESVLSAHTPPASSGAEESAAASAHGPALAPSLTPASQPTISLLTDNSSDSLSHLPKQQDTIEEVDEDEVKEEEEEETMLRLKKISRRQS
ncbi:hypothetical protein WMY93_003197 [Mugilogobius chulae]|uniref:C-type lectin domain containing 16A n=1 Tax=Mugilogobius chulae TaxID=88201 RepID=A0AAW0Q1Q0_9GOBI